MIPQINQTELGKLRQRIDATRSHAQRLDTGLRRTLEDSFGVDLSAIRVHIDHASGALARGLRANAFACGMDIFFDVDAYQPQSEAGMRLLAHEIAHVIQQASGLVGDKTFLGVPGDAWEVQADAVADRVLAGQPVEIASGLEHVSFTSRRMIIQCHDSFEHRALGDVPTSDLRAISANGAQRTEILNREINLMWQWHQNPESVTEAQIKQLCPWINTVRLSTSNLLVTYGELNALPDYIATAVVADSISKDILLPILQFIRQEGYIQLNALLNKSVSDAFQYAVFSPSQWAPGLLNKLLETQALDALTASLGIKGVDHYNALLARNACHFAPYSWYRWQSSYLIARDLATRAHATSDPNERARLTHQAWVYHGYADHFLQDSFAAGHLVNKTLIMQWFIEWAATQSTVPVADWDIVKTVTTALQPGLAGRQLYNPNYNGGSNDPQTSEDQASYLQRLQTTAVVANPTIDLDTVYQNYLTFLSSVITQSSSAAIHDYYNAHSLWVGSPAHPTAYEVWGDDTLLSGSNGADGTQFTSETAQMSQQTIRDLLANGQTSITTQQIRDYFPTTVRGDNNQMLALEAWNDTQKVFCGTNIFPQLHDIVLRILSPRFSDVSQDQDLTTRWSASLPDSGFTVTSVLNYNNRVFVGSNGYVYEVDPNNGQVLHKLLVTGSIGVGDYETQLATNGQMLFIGVHGYVYAIALNDWSRVAWQASLPKSGYTVVAVLAANGRLFAASNGYVYELNPGNGQVIHNLLLASIFGQGDYTSRLAANNQTLFVGTHGYVYGVNLNSWSGAAWEASLPSAGYTLVDVLISNNRLFAGSNGYVYELNPGNGQVLHNLLVTGSVGVGDYTTRLAANNQMLFAGVHGYVYGINLSNWSSAAWSADLADNRYTNANVLCFGDQLLAGSYGYIYRINPANGQVIRSVLMASVVGAGNYETRIVSDGQGQTLFAGVHGYAYAVSITWVTNSRNVVAPGKTLSSFALSSNAPRVYYVGTDNHTHELWWSGQGWALNDLNAQAASNPLNTAANSALTSFAIDGSAPRVYYIGADNHIHELWWGDGWGHNDLNAQATGNPINAAAGSALTSFGINGSAPRVYYIGADNHIHELWWGDGWGHNDLNAQAKGNPVNAATGSALTSFGISGNSPRVYYIGTDNHIHELWWGDGWGHNDLNAQAKGNPVNAAAGSALTSFGISGSAPRVYYIGADNHIHELWWGDGWGHNDLNAQAKGNPVNAAAGSALTSFGISGNSPRVYYIGADNHIHELWWGDGWGHNDLNAQAKGNPVNAAANTTLTSFAISGAAPRVYYMGTDEHVHELWWGDGWSHNDLSVLVGG